MAASNTALITGASGGIGAVYADRLARRGHDLILVARDKTRLNAIAERLRAETGRSVVVLAADLGARPDLLRVERRLREDPAIGMLVNNAGIAVAGPMFGSDVDRLEAMVDLNITAPLRLAHAAVAAFVPRGQGTLVNVSSVLALAPERFNATYSGTKAFVLNLSLALRTELANTAIRVQAVLPGATRTEIWGKAGIDVAAMPSDLLMDVDEMVDAALAGLDMNEAVTIPSLPDAADWSRFDDARLALGPNLSLAHAAGRYQPSPAAGRVEPSPAAGRVEPSPAAGRTGPTPAAAPSQPLGDAA
jgi:short-subunit dehydrogenase